MTEHCPVRLPAGQSPETALVDVTLIRGKVSCTYCEKEVVARGLCATHYQRWSRHGDPLFRKRLRGAPIEQRFWSKVKKGAGRPAFAPHLGHCWLWQGGLFSNGYAAFWRDGHQAYAHRVAFELTKGTLPLAVIHLDHLCRNTACVRPSHLQPVSRSENIQRGYAARNWHKEPADAT
jgi:hypothetical protein